jgi:two-component system cell cycle response regulator
MPVMDGATLVARLREDAALKEIPVIMLVPESDRESIAKVGQLGVSDHIVKPFKDEHLIEKIGRIIPFAGKVTA